MKSTFRFSLLTFGFSSYTEKKEEPKKEVATVQEKVALPVQQNGSQNSEESEPEVTQPQRPQTMREILAGIPGLSMRVGSSMFSKTILWTW